jgi:hypothetical protein
VGSFDATLNVVLGGLIHRLSALGDRHRQVHLLEERIASARRRYQALAPVYRDELRRSARRLTGLRERLAVLTGAPSVCTHCARRLAHATRQPTPPWPGGYCCGGDPERIFDELEVAALWLAGRAPSRRAMVRRPSGCLYRGSSGCRLRPVDRPNICARYLCSELTEALARTGALNDIFECNNQLEVEMARIAGLLGLAPPAPC